MKRRVRLAKGGWKLYINRVRRVLFAPTACAGAKPLYVPYS